MVVVEILEKILPNVPTDGLLNELEVLYMGLS